MPKPAPSPAPFIDVVNAKLPGQVARMRADTVRGSWKPRAKDDRDAAVDAGSVDAPKSSRARKGSAAKRTAAAKTAETSTAPAVAPTPTK